MMRMATEKMLNYAGEIEEFFAWANIQHKEWKDDSFEEVAAWLDKYVPVFKREYAKRGRQYEEFMELAMMPEWCLQYM